MLVHGCWVGERGAFGKRVSGGSRWVGMRGIRSWGRWHRGECWWVGWVKLSEFVTGVQGVGLISGCRCVSRCCGKCVDSEWWWEEFGSCVSGVKWREKRVLAMCPIGMSKEVCKCMCRVVWGSDVSECVC